MNQTDLDFYTRILRELVAAHRIEKESRILVTCGGLKDKAALEEIGFSDVTISNLDTRTPPDAFAPYKWSLQDVERLTFDDGEFDFAIVHNGLHHCYSPHRAVSELLRVARRGILAVEPRDGWLQRQFVKLGFGQEFEVDSVVKNDYEGGGVANTRIPNFIYRWSEHEVEKTARCALPWGRPHLRFFYALRLNTKRYEKLRNPLFRIVAMIAGPVLKGLQMLFPKIGNRFAFLILKPEIPKDLHPWVTQVSSGVDLNEEWVRTRYR